MSEVRLVYLPEIHIEGSQEAAAEFISATIGEEPIDLLALEGLYGKIDTRSMEKIDHALSHRQHTRDFLPDLEQELKRSKLPVGLRIMVGLAGLAPDCCINDWTYSPGKTYAKKFFGKLPLSGYEDPEVLKEEWEVINLDAENAVYAYYTEHFKGKDEKVDKILEERIHISRYSASSATLKEKYAINSKETLYEIVESYNKRRSKIAIDKTLNYRSRGTIWMVMGRGHENDIIAECEKRGISLAIPKGFPNLRMVK